MLRRFRVRVFALIVLVALAATGATAWLTARTTTAQLTESADVEKRTADMIYRTLADYGTLHGTWEGVDRTVKGLGERTGQRIRLSTLDGVVIADTDTLDQRPARPPSSRPATILDARPQLPGGTPGEPTSLPSGVLTGPGGLFGDPDLLEQLKSRRTVLRYAACLTRAGVPIARHDDDVGRGLWTVAPTGTVDDTVLEECKKRSRTSAAEAEADRMASLPCIKRLRAAEAAGPQNTSPPPASAATPPSNVPLIPEPPAAQRNRDQVARRCAEQVFAERLEPVAPVALQLKLGFGRDLLKPAKIDPRRVLAAAGVVALLVIAVTVLLSRRMLSSIAAVSQASRRLGAGDLSRRVRVHGDDEIADLAGAFNRMADSLQRSEERQRRMINDIAHELRTPLANIRGYLEALHDGVLPPDRDLFASLHEEAVLQQRLIDDLQELALAESGGLVLHLTEIDAAELLETCRTAHRAIAETAGVRLGVDVPPRHGPPLIPLEADPDRLRQAIGNLVTNAVRATEAGGAVTLRAYPADDGTAIAVADTGHGIAEEDLRNVFDRFWRADGARGRDTGGRGLGLAIAREIVLAHGGTLTAESTPGTGSTFTIWLPAGPPR